MTNPLTLDVIRMAIANRSAGFRRITPFAPAGGSGAQQ
jgi:hypothetical protein